MNLIKKSLDHSGSLYAIAYCEKLDLILVGGADRIISSWSAKDFSNQSFSIKTNSAILNLTMIGEDSLFVGLFNGSFHIIDLLKKKEEHFVTKHQKGIYACQYQKKSNKLILGTGDGSVAVWSLDPFELLVEKKISSGKIRGILMLDEDVWIGTADGFLLQIDLRTLEQKACFKVGDSGINSIEYLPSKHSILLANKDAFIEVFSLGKQKVVFSFPAHNWPIYKLIVSDVFGLISVSRDKTIKIWNLNDLSLINRISYPQFKGHTHSVNNALIVDEKNLLVTVGDDKAICFWQN